MDICITTEEEILAALNEPFGNNMEYDRLMIQMKTRLITQKKILWKIIYKKLTVKRTICCHLKVDLRLN
jgi:hypothetical protein